MPAESPVSPTEVEGPAIRRTGSFLPELGVMELVEGTLIHGLYHLLFWPSVVGLGS